MNWTTLSEEASALTGTGHKRLPEMPAEQRSKILAMHRESRSTAGMYVAVVLAAYVVLLTILLCRYARRQRYIEDVDEDGTGFLYVTNRRIRRFAAFICCLPLVTTNTRRFRGFEEPQKPQKLNISTVELMDVPGNSSQGQNKECPAQDV